MEIGMAGRSHRKSKVVRKLVENNIPSRPIQALAALSGVAASSKNENCWHHASRRDNF
jgi:hypothetical protein